MGVTVYRNLKFIPLYSPSRISPTETTRPRVSSSLLEDSKVPDTDGSDNDSALETTASKSVCESSEHHRSECDAETSPLPEDSCYLPVKRGRVLTKFISTPCPPSRLPVKNMKSCGKVLTSREQLKILDEKAKKKEAIEREKEEKKKSVRRQKKFVMKKGCKRRNQEKV